MQVLHFSNTGRLTPEVERLLRALHARGFHVEGRLFDRAAFDERLAKVLEETEAEQLVVARPGLEKTPPARGYRAFVRGLDDRLFGLRRGLCALAFPFRPSEKLKEVRKRALVAANTLLGLRLLVQGSFFCGVPTAVLSAWVYSYVSNAEPIYRFKSHGVAVRLEDDGQEGANIRLTPNYLALAATTFLEELAVNALLRLSIGGTKAVLGDQVALGLDALVSAYAKTATEAPIAALYRRAEIAERNGDGETAAALRARAETLQDVIYNFVFPALKFLQLPFPTTDPHLQVVSFVARTFANGVYAAMGTYGAVRGLVEKVRSRPRRDASCATVLRFADHRRPGG